MGKIPHYTKNSLGKKSLLIGYSKNSNKYNKKNNKYKKDNRFVINCSHTLHNNYSLKIFLLVNGYQYW